VQSKKGANIVTGRTESQIAVSPRAWRIALAIVSATLLMATVVSRRADAQVFVTLHSFNGSDGSGPQAGLVRDSAGNLYGTTFAGGFMSCGNFGCGTVFKLDPSGNLTVLHNFGDGTVANDGKNPQAGLVLDASGIYLYGTTSNGGSSSDDTVFEIATTPQQGTQVILNQVTTLYTQGALKQGQDNSLDKELNQAISLMNSGKNSGAIQNRQDFIAEVEDLESSGVLTSPQAEPLTSEADTGLVTPELLISEANTVIAELQ